MDSKYEPTPYMKRVIIFNRKIEEAYQTLRKAHRKYSESLRKGDSNGLST